MKHLASTILFASILGTAALAAAESSTTSSIDVVSPASADAPVVSGTNVPVGQWPDAVAVLARDAMCTGTLIAPDVVLTAGHCIETDPVEVVVGSVDLAKPGGTAIAVKKAIAYPKWDRMYDVGVLVLEHPAPVMPRSVASACIAKEHLVPGAKVHVVGFGLTTADGTGMNTRLHQAMLPVVDATCAHDAACEPDIAPGGEFTAGGGGVDACFGDSGGPIYIDTAHGAALIGVVSRGESVIGEPCGGGGVYVRADAVVSWIEKVTGRKLTRSTCDEPADGPGDREAAEAGGCSAGRGLVGGGALLGLLVLALLAARPRLRVPVSFD
jgi:secreted trypsin-like serine protease